MAKKKQGTIAKMVEKVETFIGMKPAKPAKKKATKKAAKKAAPKKATKKAAKKKKK